MSYNKTTFLKLSDNDEEEGGSESVTAASNYQSSAKKADPADASRKLLLRVSLFERKRNEATVNIHHHDGQCDTIKIPDSPQTSGSALKLADGGKCAGNPIQDSLEQLYQMAENLSEPAEDLRWSNVRYQVMETTTETSPTMGSHYAQYPNKSSTIRKKSLSKSRFSGHKMHARKSRNNSRASPKGMRLPRPAVIKGGTQTSPPTSESSLSTGSFTINTSTSISNMRVTQGKAKLKPKQLHFQKSIAIQKYLHDYHQKSVGVQFNSEHVLFTPCTNTTHVLTVMGSTRSVGTLVEKPKGKTHEPKKDSIVDLFHALHMQDFSEKLAITQSDPSLSCTAYEDYNKQQEVAAMFHKYNPWPCAHCQTDEVRIVGSDEMVSGKSPGYSQTTHSSPGCPTAPLRITRSRLANRVFPVLSPSGEHIGSLIGATVPKNPNYPTSNRAPWGPCPKKGYHVYNSTLRHPGFPAFCASKIKTPGSPYMVSCRGLTKNFQKPVVIASTKQMCSVGMQVDGSPKTVEAATSRKATPKSSALAGRKSAVGQWRTSPHRTMLRPTTASRYGKKTPYGSAVSTLLATINLEHDDDSLSSSRSTFGLLAQRADPHRLRGKSKNKLKAAARCKVKEAATITSGTQGVKTRVATGDLIEL